MSAKALTTKDTKKHEGEDRVIAVIGKVSYRGDADIKKRSTRIGELSSRVVKETDYLSG
jgi:hypothetical protein